MASSAFIDDDKLPDDVLRKAYNDDCHALFCLSCGFEWKFDPTMPNSIGAPLYALTVHRCRHTTI